MKITRIFDLLEQHKNEFNKPNTFGAKIDGKWKDYSTDEFVDTVNNFSYGLLALGIKAGDKIATISNNRPEWNYADMGIMQIGAIHVPIYPNVTESEYDYILNHSEAKLVFISSDLIYSRIKKIAEESEVIKDVYSFEKLKTHDKQWTEILEMGEKNPLKEKVDEIKNSIKPDDIATIIYTSGTTGKPKGVVLTHANIVSNFVAVKPIIPLDSTSKVLSYLPLCHIYERMLNYSFQNIGASIYYVESLGTIVDNIQEIKPEGFTTVPRLLEKVYDRIMFKGRELKGIKKAIFDWSVKLGMKYKEENNSAWYCFKLKIADKLVFNKWRAAFGGNIKVAVSGGAALQKRLAHIFWAAKVPVIEGYGLTETSPVIAVNTFDPGGKRFGTVGLVLEGVEVKIAENGEILTKGPNLMQGYYKAPELTKQVIDEDGWFHTGDIGHLEDGKYLKITGRSKSAFKTSMGKYVVPELIENKLRESKFIEQVMITGENEKFVSAVIVPEFQHLKAWCIREGHGFGNRSEVIKNPEVIKQFMKEVNEYNKLFNQHERIIKIAIVQDDWTVDTGELTPTMKVKRKVVEAKYEKNIKKLYS